MAFLSNDELDEETKERQMNLGFTNSEVEELLCQGVKPWDEDAWAVMDALNDSKQLLGQVK